MNKKYSTKRALIASLLALCMCFTMLIGTTYAWFTDSVTSKGNVIQSGTLDIQLWQHFEGSSVEITEDSDPIFGKADSENANANTADTLWEPGKTQTVYLSVKNAGTLDIKYKVAIEVTNVTKNLTKVVEYIITPDAKIDAPVTKNILDWTKGKTVVNGYNEVTTDTDLPHGVEHFFALSVHMDELAGNEYQDGTIEFNIRILAGQLASEDDSFDNQYDADALYPATNHVDVPVNEDFPVAGLDVDIYSKNGKKVGSFNYPAGAIADDAQKVGGTIEETDTYEGGNITVENGKTARYFNVSPSGMKNGNTDPVTTRLYMGEGFDPDTFKAYHYDEEIHCTYSPDTGYVAFQSATYSPFAIVYDENSVYVPPVYPDIPEAPALPAGCPTATVVKSPEYENVDLPWGSYGQWSPSVGLDAFLEAAYTFTCDETADEALANDYAEWYCDFVVMLDKDLTENSIFLGGMYGSFGWVGFHNGDLTLEANTEIPLLGSVTNNPWTYADVASFVGEFVCGVGDVNDALAGATFTVMLRLTNPNNENDIINVATIKHTFKKDVKVDGQTALNDAIASNNGERIVLADGEYNMITTTKDVTIAGDRDVVLDLPFQAVGASGNVITIEGVTVKGNSTGDYYSYLFNGAEKVIYKNCLIMDQITTYCDTEFINCEFVNTFANDYSVFCYYGSNITFTDCDFNTQCSKAIKVYDEGNGDRTLTLTRCTFTTETANKAAVEVDSSQNKGHSYYIYMNECSVSGAYTKLWNADAGEDERVNVCVDDVWVKGTAPAND